MTQLRKAALTECLPVNFDRLITISCPTARIRRAAKLEVSSNLGSRKPEAGQPWSCHQRPMNSVVPYLPKKPTLKTGANACFRHFAVVRAGQLQSVEAR